MRTSLMIPIIQEIRSALHYVRAGDCFDRKAYLKAREHIDRALDLAGPKLANASLFQFFLRGGMIEKKLGNTAAALRHIESASEQIDRRRKLSATDRSYLLDYCDVLASEVVGSPPPALRLKADQYLDVTPRFRGLYPLEWS
jgi:hypothetical protein